MKKLLVLLVTLLMLLSSCGKEASEGGQIISAKDAEQLFGPVRYAKDIASSELTNLTARSRNVMMFGVQKGLIITNDERQVIYPDSATVRADDTLVVYATAKVKELIAKGKSSIIKVEKRDTKITITSGNYVLEYGAWCPPECGSGEK